MLPTGGGSTDHFSVSAFFEFLQTLFEGFALFVNALTKLYARPIIFPIALS
jgi:hypothetical protein